jgi:hypothetical protein
MLRTIFASLLMLAAFTGPVHAEEIRIGAATVDATPDPREAPSYFDTYPGTFCGVKAIRVQVNGPRNSYNRDQLVQIGRIYFAYQKRSARGPFSAYVKVNAYFHKGESTAWIQLPKMDSCLTKVRVYAQGAYDNDVLPGGESFRLVVYGAR